MTSTKTLEGIIGTQREDIGRLRAEIERLRELVTADGVLQRAIELKQAEIDRLYNAVEKWCEERDRANALTAAARKVVEAEADCKQIAEDEGHGKIPNALGWARAIARRGSAIDELAQLLGDEPCTNSSSSS